MPSRFPRRSYPKKVILLGSGALKIGQAGEFDYSGSQAIKALREEGIKVVLVNPNIATVQTSEGIADKVYFLPITVDFVERIIAKEKPEGILLAWGGQTALNCGIELHTKGVLKKYKVKVYGTPIEAIQKTEDRQLFNDELSKMGIRFPTSMSCTSEKQAETALKKIGFPVIIRAGFTLGGGGSGFAMNMEEFGTLVKNAFAYSPQILVEESLKGWKEVEYEVVRDSADNCITVCNMENLDPLGIHTGESIVIAPSQTLNNSEYYMLRSIALKVIRHLGIVGECNIQYALDPKSAEYRVIEVNARLSRSSALASKATGYPLAYVAAKLALGYRLDDLKNSVTKVTKAFFEPSLDYVALKIPRWDLNKFRKVSHSISSEMKSVGEIMALGRNFEEALQKGLRMLQIGAHGITHHPFQVGDIRKALENPTPTRIFAVYEALKKGMTVQEIANITKIDEWFLGKLKRILSTERKIQEKGMDLFSDPGLFSHAKKEGFSDAQISKILGEERISESDVRAKRKKLGILPVVKQIDTLAAEFPAKTNYLYLTYHGIKNDVPVSQKMKKKAIVLGSGPYCIGSSVEFDWSAVSAVNTLKKEKYETVMVNYNPETVSTDYDTCDTLYFDELSLERVLDIYEIENPQGIILFSGGQIPNNLAKKLGEAGVRILGTSPKEIHRAESRQIFSELLDTLKVDQPEWKEFSTIEGAKSFAKKVSYPVLIRPSYVLSGAAMAVALSETELENYLSKAVKVTSEAPVVVSKFEVGAREIEIDAVAGKGELLLYAISEHVENAGVHSGDATMVLPPQKTYLETIRRVKEIAKLLAKKLNITGPFNIQFLAKNNQIKVIELNLRASRSFPFVSKVTGHNFIEIATRATLGKIESKAERRRKYNTVDLDFVGVKASQFSFARLRGADPVLSVEMASTGEVGCFGNNLEEAFLKAMISTGFSIPQKNIFLSIGKTEEKLGFLEWAEKLVEMKFTLFATEGTFQALQHHHIPVKLLAKVSENKSPNILSYLCDRKIDLVINLPRSYAHEEKTDGYKMRRAAIDNNIPLITNFQVAKLLVQALEKWRNKELPITDWGVFQK
ncbi:carbamoyl-phosphate synthase (glutamine-hydrolyzing) large subunit [Candidatus Peregrinibacteria bacterium]|nr:carbamoyl-phosphate synthase (glutamine-hydrolyzing) large subunit [Candidatus Peregrinibacteria bacterium]